MGLLIYKYEPFWQEVSVKSLILRWPLRPVGLLFFLAGANPCGPAIFEACDSAEFMLWIRDRSFLLLNIKPNVFSYVYLRRPCRPAHVFICPRDTGACFINFFHTTNNNISGMEKNLWNKCLCPEIEDRGAYCFCHSFLLSLTLLHVITFEQWVLELWYFTWIFPFLLICVFDNCFWSEASDIPDCLWNEVHPVEISFLQIQSF